MDEIKIDCIVCDKKNEFIPLSEWYLKLKPSISRQRIHILIRNLEKSGCAYKHGHSWMIKKDTPDPRKSIGRPKK
jgi:hypothetical protein